MIKINKKILSKVLNEDNSIIGPYTNVNVSSDVVTITIELDGIKKTKDINVNELLSKYKNHLSDLGIHFESSQGYTEWRIESIITYGFKDKKKDFVTDLLSSIKNKKFKTELELVAGLTEFCSKNLSKYQTN